MIIEAVKRQMEGEDTILRLYECYGMRTDVILTLGQRPGSVRLANLLEDDIGAVDHRGSQVFLTLRPYEIVTLKIAR